MSNPRNTHRLGCFSIRQRVKFGMKITYVEALGGPRISFSGGCLNTTSLQPMASFSKESLCFTGEWLFHVSRNEGLPPNRRWPLARKAHAGFTLHTLQLILKFMGRALLKSTALERLHRKGNISVPLKTLPEKQTMTTCAYFAVLIILPKRIKSG